MVLCNKIKYRKLDLQPTSSTLWQSIDANILGAGEGNRHSIQSARHPPGRPAVDPGRPFNFPKHLPSQLTVHRKVMGSGNCREAAPFASECQPRGSHGDNIHS
jgi:hypothetical protein